MTDYKKQTILLNILLSLRLIKKKNEFIIYSLNVFMCLHSGRCICQVPSQALGFE